MSSATKLKPPVYFLSPEKKQKKKKKKKKKKQKKAIKFPHLLQKLVQMGRRYDKVQKII